MIGGIQIFLPLSPVKARVCVTNVAIGEIQPVVTVKELEKMLEAYQVEGKEHSEEWLNCFSREAEKETIAALKLIAEEEQEYEVLTSWEMELEMLEDWLNYLEPTDDCHEKKVKHMMVEEHYEDFFKNFNQGDEQMRVVMSRHTSTDEGTFQSEEKLEEYGIQPT
jgi:hypothetical protein